MTPDQEKFEDILVAHAAGKLNAEEQQWLENYLATHPEAEKELLLVAEIRSVLVGETRENNPREGLDVFMAAIQRHPKRDSGQSLLGRLNAWLGNVGFSPALASAIVVVQIGVIAMLLAANPQQPQQQVMDTDYRGIKTQTIPSPDLKLTVSPSASFADVAELLKKNGCRIVGGPSEYGEIWIVVEDPAQLGRTTETLGNSSLIDDVMATHGTEHK